MDTAPHDQAEQRDREQAALAAFHMAMKTENANEFLTALAALDYFVQAADEQNGHMVLTVRPDNWSPETGDPVSGIRLTGSVTVIEIPGQEAVELPLWDMAVDGKPVLYRVSGARMVGTLRNSMAAAADKLIERAREKSEEPAPIVPPASMN